MNHRITSNAEPDSAVTRRATIGRIAVVVAIGFTAMGASVQGQEPSSFEQVLTRHAATLGGPLAARIPDLHIEGVLEGDGSSGRFVFAWLAPDNFHFSYEMGGQRHQQIWTHSGSWSARDGAEAPLDVQEMFLAPWVFALTAPRRSGKVVEERDKAFVVERETEFGRRDLFTVDRTTGRVIRVVTPLTEGGDSIRAEFGEFRVQQGFHLPYRIEARGPFGPWVLRDLQYRLAGGVSPDLFARRGTPADRAWRDPWLAPADYEVAFTQAQRRFAQEPGSLEAATALATAAVGAGAWDEFVRALGAAERLDATAPAVLALRGRRLLWEHRIAEAVPVLRAAVAADTSGATGPVTDLATGLYHAGQLSEAAALFRRAGRREGFARVLEEAGDEAHTVRWPAGSAEVVIPFLQADPLPVVDVTVNGRRRTFFIDTGAAIVYLFPDIAAELGIEVFRGGPGTYAFGRQVETDYAILDSFGIGPVTISRVPAAVREFEGLREAFGQPALAGALPLAVFQRFLTTMDFPGRRLVLRPRQPMPPTPNAVRVSFLLVGEHFLLLPGRVNGAEPLWFFLDTGFTAGGFLAPMRELVRSGVIRSPDELRAPVPLTVDRLEVGPLQATGIASRSLVFPESLETSTGFRIGGLVSKTFLAPYRVTWDFERREVVFER
jgi:hypothetical protein